MTQAVVARDPRAERSRRALLDAAGALVDEGGDADLADLTITAVVGRAGVSRPTFYQHFDDVAAVVRHAALERLEAAFPDEDGVPVGLDEQAWADHAQAVMRLLLENLRPHARFYHRVLNGPGAVEVHRDTIDLVTRRILSRSPLGPVILHSATIDPVDRATIISGGMLWMMMGWLASDFTGANAPSRMAHRLSQALIELSVGSPDAVSRVIAASHRPSPAPKDH